MKKVAYKTKKGTVQYKPQLSEKDLWSEDTVGWCLNCGCEVDGVEPDARKYTCETCNLPKVYGLGELAMMGLVVIK